MKRKVGPRKLRACLSQAVSSCFLLESSFGAKVGQSFHPHHRQTPHARLNSYALEIWCMSSIKSAFIIDGIARIVEVHGATWQYLDLRKYAAETAAYYRRILAETEAKGAERVYQGLAAQYERYVEDPSKLNSGLANEIWRLGLSPITDSNKREWARYLLREDMPGDADNTDEPPAVLADLDTNHLYDTERNFYARYEDTLPGEWSYERITPARMVDLLENRLSAEDHARLNAY